MMIPGRGLRQEDPISPYLFLIYAEGLSALINHAETVGKIRGIKVCPEAHPVMHLLIHG